MKYIWSYSWILVVTVFLFGSCNKDLGNYEYSDIDSIKILNITDTVSVGLRGQLKVNPSFIVTLGQLDTAQFEYEWAVFDKGVANMTMQKSILSTDKILDLPVPYLVGSYPSYFSVKNKETGQTWIKRFLLQVKGAIGKYGWFVLHDKDGAAHVDFYEDDDKNWNSYPKVVRDFPSYLNNDITGEPMKIEGKGISLTNYFSRDAVTTASKYYLYINTTSQTYKVNMSDGYLYNPVAYNFLNETGANSPSSADFIIPMGSASSYTIKEKSIYLFNFVNNRYYMIPLNRTNAGQSYDISNFRATPNLRNTNMTTLLFDTTNKRFVKVASSSNTALLIETPGQAFDASKVNMDLVWMDYTNAYNGQAVALLKSGTTYKLARMELSPTGAFKAYSFDDVSTSFAAVADAKYFAIDKQYGYLFYATNDKVYQYDMDAKVLKVAKNLEGRKVSLLKFESLNNIAIGSDLFINAAKRMEPVSYSLILGTYDEANPNTTGKVEFLRVQGLMGDLKESFKPFDGLGKVVDINYVDH